MLEATARKSGAEVKTQVQQHTAQLAAELQQCKAGLEEQLQHISEACLAATTQPREARSQQHTDVVSTSVV